jgi:hypothetical protein
LTWVGNIASTPKERKLIMKFGKLSVLSAAALLAGGMSLALAQSNPAPSGSSSSGSMGTANPQGQCWDQVSNTVKDKSGSASGARTPGGVTTGSSPSGQNNNSTGTGNTQTRPSNAANLPAC